MVKYLKTLNYSKINFINDFEFKMFFYYKLYIGSKFDIMSIILKRFLS